MDALIAFIDLPVLLVIFFAGYGSLLLAGEKIREVWREQHYETKTQDNEAGSKEDSKNQLL